MRQVAALLFDNSAQASDSIDSTSQANFIHGSINFVNGKFPGGIDILGDGAIEKEFVLGQSRYTPKYGRVLCTEVTNYLRNEWTSTLFRTTSLSRIVPWNSSSRKIALKRLDLPDPVLPTIATCSPFLIFSVTAFRASSDAPGYCKCTLWMSKSPLRGQFFTTGWVGPASSP